MDGTKADEIALALEEAIVSGALAPGSVLRQEQVSAQYEVSRTPVREALLDETVSPLPGPGELWPGLWESLRQILTAPHAAKALRAMFTYLSETPETADTAST